MSKTREKIENSESKSSQKSAKSKGNGGKQFLPSYVSLLSSSSSVGTIVATIPSPKSVPSSKPSSSSRTKSQPSLTDYVCPVGDRESEREFYMYSYKTKLCTEKNSVECLKAYGSCPNYHYPNKRRRNPRKFTYTHEACSYVKVQEGGQYHWRQATSCPKGDQCDKSHTLMEAMYHPDVYKTVLCSNFVEAEVSRWTCKWKRMCAHAHGQEELEWTRRRFPRTNGTLETEVDGDDEELIDSDEDPNLEINDGDEEEGSDNDTDGSTITISQTPKSASSSSSSLPTSSLPSPALPPALPSSLTSISSTLSSQSTSSLSSKNSSAWTDSSKVDKIRSGSNIQQPSKAVSTPPTETKLHSLESEPDLTMQTLSVDDPILETEVERPSHPNGQWIGLGMGTGLGVDLFARDSPSSSSRGLYSENGSDRKPRSEYYFANSATIVPAQFSHVYDSLPMPVLTNPALPSMSSLFGVSLATNGSSSPGKTPERLKK